MNSIFKVFVFLKNAIFYRIVNILYGFIIYYFYYLNNFVLSFIVTVDKTFLFDFPS